VKRCALNQPLQLPHVCFLLSTTSLRLRRCGRCPLPLLQVGRRLLGGHPRRLLELCLVSTCERANRRLPRRKIAHQADKALEERQQPHIASLGDGLPHARALRRKRNCLRRRLLPPGSPAARLRQPAESRRRPSHRPSQRLWQLPALLDRALLDRTLLDRATMTIPPHTAAPTLFGGAPRGPTGSAGTRCRC